MSNIYSECPIAIPHKKQIEYARKLMFTRQLTIAAKAGKNVYENEYIKINNLPYARELNGKITIQEIFRNHWDEFKQKCKTNNKPIRESIHKNVEAMIDCKNFKKGYLWYECPKCGNFEIRGLSCHSRFCPSCGKKYRDARANEISKTCIYAPHRHITWTIAEELRDYFQRHKDMYDELFAAVNDVLTFLIQGKSRAARKRNERLGFISTIHTFGRDMKFNPHIHTLIAECTIDKNGKRKPYTFFNYESLRKAFMNQLLKRMYHFLKKSASNKELTDFCKLRQDLFKKKDSGFYVNAPQKECKSPKQIKRIVNYVCRYAGHPAMSESRIISYNKDTKMIIYYYDPHEDDAIINDDDKIGRQYVEENVYEFIAKLIVHIPEKSVHSTRYYGFYANHSSLDTVHQPKLFKWEEISKMKSNLDWRLRLIQSYKYDPLLCHCGATMVIVPDLCFFEGYTKEDG